MRARSDVILGELGQRDPQMCRDVRFDLFQLRILKHRCLGGAFTHRPR